jgi:hypothetical protein
MLWQILQSKSAEKGFPSSLHYAVTRGASKYNEADVSVFPLRPNSHNLFYRPLSGTEPCENF